MFLLDPTDEDVVPVVRELQRRLFIIDTNQGDDQNNTSLEVEVDEDDGMFHPNYTFYLRKCYISFLNNIIFHSMNYVIL